MCLRGFYLGLILTLCFDYHLKIAKIVLGHGCKFVTVLVVSRDLMLSGVTAETSFFVFISDKKLRKYHTLIFYGSQGHVRKVYITHCTYSRHYYY